MLKQAVLCTALMGSSIAGIAAADSDTQTADFTHVFAAHETELQLPPQLCWRRSWLGLLTTLIYRRPTCRPSN